MPSANFDHTVSAASSRLAGAGRWSGTAGGWLNMVARLPLLQELSIALGGNWRSLLPSGEVLRIEFCRCQPRRSVRDINARPSTPALGSNVGSRRRTPDLATGRASRRRHKIPAEPLPDHRIEYLDYEGPVSGNRGTVTQFDVGTFTLVSESDGLRVELSGRKLRCIAELSDSVCNMH